MWFTRPLSPRNLVVSIKPALQVKLSRCEEENLIVISTIEKGRVPTHLSTYIWGLKDRGKVYIMDQDINDRALPFNPITIKCCLCLKEKWNIMFKPKAATLNARSEIFSTCRHRLDEVLANY